MKLIFGYFEKLMQNERLFIKLNDYYLYDDLELYLVSLQQQIYTNKLFFEKFTVAGLLSLKHKYYTLAQKLDIAIVTWSLN
jgi:hypothetical protein